MDQAHLSKVELGHRVPTEKQATALARYFGVESHDMEARRIAEKFRQDFADNPAAEMAVQMLNDRPPTGSTPKRNKQDHKTWR
jgi:hypothetical protein